MKFAGIFMVGYVVLVIGVGAALWKVGFLQQIGAGWTIIGIVIAVGLGIMLAIGAQPIDRDRSLLIARRTADAGSPAVSARRVAAEERRDPERDLRQRGGSPLVHVRVGQAPARGPQNSTRWP